MAAQHDRPHVLFVDDEKELLLASELQMRHLGLTVTGATGGADALAAFSQAPFAFDILVTDLFMPGMDGRTLIERVRAIRPDLPVVLLSGMGDAIDEDLLDAVAPVHVMGKPIRIAALVDIVRKLTGQRPPG